MQLDEYRTEVKRLRALLPAGDTQHHGMVLNASTSSLGIANLNEAPPMKEMIQQGKFRKVVKVGSNSFALVFEFPSPRVVFCGQVAPRPSRTERLARSHHERKWAAKAELLASTRPRAGVDQKHYRNNNNNNDARQSSPKRTRTNIAAHNNHDVRRNTCCLDEASKLTKNGGVKG